MAGTVNKVILVARLGTAPEIKSLEGGNSVCNFTVATDEGYKSKSGEYVQKTEWHRIVTWGKLAEICGKYLEKGKLVYLEGKLQTREWEKDGVKRYTTEINCNEMKMLGAKSDNANNGSDNSDVDRSAGDASDVPF